MDLGIKQLGSVVIAIMVVAALLTITRGEYMTKIKVDIIEQINNINYTGEPEVIQ